MSQPRRSSATRKAPAARRGAVPARVNHKSEEAQAARDALDVRVLETLSTKKAKDNGLSKAAIAEELGEATDKVKASLNRLAKLDLTETSGTTMNTTYAAVEGAVKKLREIRKKTATPPARVNKTRAVGPSA